MLKNRHGEHVIDYLKLGGREDEWKLIPHLIESKMLNKVRQLSIKLHFGADDSIEQYISKLKMIKSLEDLGFIRFSSRGNPFSKKNIVSLGKRDFVCYEMSWYNSHLYHNK